MELRGMNKKAALAFFLSLFSTLTAFSTNYEKEEVEKWVDSVYSSLTYEERIGQLIISKNTNQDILAKIENGLLPIGGIFSTSSNVYPSNNQIYISPEAVHYPFWSLTCPSNKPNYNGLKFPGDVVKAAMPSQTSVRRLETAEANALRLSGVNMMMYEDTYLENINGEFVQHLKPSALSYSRQIELSQLQRSVYQEAGIVSAMPLHLSFDNYEFVKYIPDELYASDEWSIVKDEYSMLLLDRLDFKPGWHPDKFRKEIVKGLIRKKFDYNGVLAVDIQNFNDQYTKTINGTTVELDLIISGVDLIVTDDPETTYRNLYTNWKNHQIRNAEIEGMVKTVLRQKYRQFNTAFQKPKINTEEIADLIYESYAESISLVKNDNDVIPVKNLELSHFASLSIGSDKLTRFQETLDHYTAFTHFVLPANQINTEAFTTLVKRLGAFDQVVVGVHAPFNKDILALLSALEFETNVITALFDEKIPDNLSSVSNSILIAYDNNDYLQEVASQIIFGARPCQGNYPLATSEDELKSIKTTGLQRLSFSTPYSAGLNKKYLSKVDSIAMEGIRQGATPGCQVLVARHGKVVYEKSFGNYTYENNYPVTERTMYDLASVTKVAATTQAIMFLVDQGVLDLNKKLSYYLPELAATNKGDLIINDILMHQSGLKAFLPFWHQTIDFENLQVPFYSNAPDEEYQLEVGYGMYGSLRLKDSLYQWTVNSELRTKPRRKKFEPYDYKYSDLGFYLMYALAERLLNQPMDEFLAQNLYEPMGMSYTTYNPLCKFPASYIAPTENDKTFRHSLVWGTVHDQVAAMNGGVSGHAGLFGNAMDLAKLGQMHLQHGEYGGQKYFSSGVIEDFISSHNKDNRRGLGWDKPDPVDVEYNPTSKYASPKTFGHRGFTGTVIWVDPEEDLIYVFLSNRIYPEMSNGKLNELDIRKKIHDVVYESIINFKPELN